MAPSRRVAGKIRPYFIVGLESGAATFFGLRFVWPDFLSQRCPSLYADTPLLASLAELSFLILMPGPLIREIPGKAVG